jgi:hypothetical protein
LWVIVMQHQWDTIRFKLVERAPMATVIRHYDGCTGAARVRQMAEPLWAQVQREPPRG